MRLANNLTLIIPAITKQHKFSPKVIYRYYNKSSTPISLPLINKSSLYLKLKNEIELTKECISKLDSHKVEIRDILKTIIKCDVNKSPPEEVDGIFDCMLSKQDPSFIIANSMLMLEIINQSNYISSGWKLVEYLRKYTEEKNNPANLLEHFRLIFKTHMDACLFRGSYKDILRCFNYFPKSYDVLSQGSIFLLSQNKNFCDGDPLLIDLLKSYGTLGSPFPHQFPSLYKRFFPPNRYKTILNLNHRDCRCSNCGQELPKISVTQKERDILAREIMRKVIMDPGNVFLKDEGSFDKTLDQFVNFTHSQEEKFDCIFDWPNLFYGKYWRADKSFTGFMETVREACEALNRELGLRNFCMVGKEKKQFFEDSAHFQVIRKKLRKQGISIKSFNVPYTSIDDPFMIYLALVSHKNCHLVSQDKYGTHKQILSQASKLILTKWQASRQIAYFNFKPNTDFSFRKASQWDPVLHFSDDGFFHIPYDRINPKIKDYITPEDRMNFFERRYLLACISEIK